MKKKIKITPKLKKKLHFWWHRFKLVEDAFYMQLAELEKKMAKDTKIKDIEFIHTDMGWCGIGNISRTMPLVQQEELE